jgi:predicted AlkP superfamily phosphohydrolase/phosphomutase
VGCAGERAAETSGKRVIVLGFDGMDHTLTEELLGRGRLPNLARLAAAGGFSPLTTSIPPQSPVAWSEFITGMDAGGHGIFDFLHRDPSTLVPFLSTSRTQASTRTLHLGGWQIPVGAAGVLLLRRGTPFWEVLETAGVTTSIVRMPANFPPSGSASEELSGMGTPDVLGGYGTFTLVTSAPDRAPDDLAGGGVVSAANQLEPGVFRAIIEGPPNPFRVDGSPLRSSLTILVDPAESVARLEAGEEVTVLNRGEWSDWHAVEFELTPLGGTLRGIVRFYLKNVHPDLQVYVTPVNLDPLEPALPISSPPSFAAELGGGLRYYTQGMPEDTKAFTTGVLDAQEFLAQADLVRAEVTDQFLRFSERFLEEDGDRFLFYYFGFLDQVSHVFWHTMDVGHPAHDPERDAAHATVIEDLYTEADRLVGEAMARLREDDLLVVMSDHGFTSWRRAFSLNRWLEEAGYLTVRDDDVALRDERDFLTNVDWSRTQAYGLGLTGLYLNLEGRELAGIVPSSQRALLLDEIERRLIRVVDPASGEPVVARLHRREAYRNRGALERGPDLVVEYVEGVRSSDASASGKTPLRLIEDNVSLWSGDHIMDHTAVPGVLFVSRRLTGDPRGLDELAPSLLAEFGTDFAAPEPPGGS